ncbi:DUF429 domain-containing protein [Eisenibacter elegans]|jgi:predicted nuclease with RNAse H fold|uniref:DUF429 domain-containing protein n=1 Tax=Eisenibacter elegans TaxID=997 RepID=UPI0004080A76|nr:DUF429 domain-containing protein [Eisenibacter elegans]
MRPLPTELSPDALLVGVDYGAKLAGTTALFYRLPDGQCCWELVAAKKDADQWLLDRLHYLQPALVFIDAPLSLPKVYQRLGEADATADFFYRVGDKALQAMSPMFLGGLTARAIRLRYALGEVCPLIETYPGAQAERLGLKPLGYKKSLDSMADVLKAIQALYPELHWGNLPSTWHEVDALLAWLGAYHYQQGLAEIYGDPEEGAIYL